MSSNIELCKMGHKINTMYLFDKKILMQVRIAQELAPISY